MKGVVLSRPRFMPRRQGMRHTALRRLCPRPAWAPAALLLGGVTLGGALAAWGMQRQEAFFSSYVQLVLQQHGAGVLGVFSYAFLPSFALLAGMALLGSSCLGAPFVCALLTVRGMSAGCLTAGLFAALGARGLAACFILLLAPTLVQFCALAQTANSALVCSCALFEEQILHRSKKAAASMYLPGLGRCFLQAGMAMLAAAALEALLAAVFAPVLL